MPLQNRVTPLGDLIATPARGLVYGNRGCLHDAEGRIRRRWQVRRWIACRLAFKGWHRSPLLQPGKFTELFFLDEATASLDEPSEAALYRLLGEKLPDTTIVSIGHRSTLDAFHQRNVTLIRDGDRFTLREGGASAKPS